METRPYMILFLQAKHAAVPVRDGIRVANDGDFATLAEVMADAYRGTVDDEGEDPPAALEELHRMAAGAYGTAMREAWLVHEGEQGEIWSAVACTRWHGRPFVAQAFTRPDVQRRGLAGRLMLAVAGVLQAGGEAELSLVVTRKNPAMQMYERMGFVENAWPEASS